MKRSTTIFIYLVDLLIVFLVFLVFLLVDYIHELTRTSYLLGGVLIWWVLSVVTSKLTLIVRQKRFTYAVATTLCINFLTISYLYCFYKFVGRLEDFQLAFFGSFSVITVLELLFGHFIQYFNTNKIFYQHEDEELQSYFDGESDRGAKIAIEKVPQYLSHFWKTLQDHSLSNADEWISKYAHSFDRFFCFCNSPDSLVSGKSVLKPDCNILVNLVRTNQIKYLNKYFNRVNEILPDGGYFICCTCISGLRKQRIISAYPAGVNWLIYTLDYLWNRVCPKVSLTKKFYFKVTKGKNRVFPRPEILGRLYSCGFSVIEERFINGLFWVVAKKKREPFYDQNPSYSSFVRLKRVGKDGELIGIYKFRTMYAFSEYLQPYIYEHNGLKEGGKFSHDYRVSTLGRILRKYWLDELPMVVNLVRGDIKLVGVRPLSEHYFSLYTPEMQALRIKTKPGLLPPFYADSPQNIEEIQKSEEIYLKDYLEHPYLTDWKYFWKIVGCILFKGKHSS